MTHSILRLRIGTFMGACALLLCAAHPAVAGTTPQLTDLVNPLIGTSHGGNTFPGATLPFGMLAWSPENTRGNHTRTAAPGGYQYHATRIRGFSLTHLSGTGCAGASGDIPFMPVTVAVTTSPSTDMHDARYASNFSHAAEHAVPGNYRVKLANGVAVDLTAALRSGMAGFDFPAGKPANLLLRTSDSEVGSSAASVEINPKTRTITGSVTSGNFCGYLSRADQHSYYTLYFVARFDRPFIATGTWHDGTVRVGATSALGGTGYDAKGFPVAGRGSGAWVGFAPGSDVHVRVGISYVSLANARANLAAEIPTGTMLAQVREHANATWNKALGRITITGGTPTQRTVFYTALYHVLLEPNVFSDVNGQYRGFDQKIHRVHGRQKIQYANFSGWDVYRSQLQLLTWLMPQVGSDFAQSLYNQARQNHGEWDRWTHESGATHVMDGDPSAPAVADIVAFGGTAFDIKGAYASLKFAATHVTPGDTSSVGCDGEECPGQRPSLDQWMRLHYIAAQSHSTGGAAETLEDASADFALSQLAQYLGDRAGHALFLTRAGYWRNLFNPHATAHAGYIQNRNADGSWPAFKPGTGDGFVEGSAAQYLWMVPFDEHGLAMLMGGNTKAAMRLDAFFHQPDGRWALTNAGPLHAEVDNEPSIETPWLYDYLGQPWKTQQTVRASVDRLWKNAPDGIPGNDDLGEMSSWYVWAAMGMYPEIPGRADLLLASPLFPHIVVHRAAGDVVIDAPDAATGAMYVHALHVNDHAWTKPWLPASFATHGGHLIWTLGVTPDLHWGDKVAAMPPSFPPPARTLRKS
ncbi:MAG TPA: GH92 family glycosyl hydrolase [Rhodanobacteraceae bacterium]